MKRSALTWAIVVVGLGLSACGPTVELPGVLFNVAFTTPSAGGIDISTEVLPRIGFNRAVDSVEAITLLHVEDADGTDVAVDHLFLEEGAVALLAPRAFLEPETTYTIVVPAQTPSLDGVEIGAELRASFTTESE